MKNPFIKKQTAKQEKAEREVGKQHNRKEEMLEMKGLKKPQKPKGKKK